MSNQTTQPKQPKLVECNRCKDAGFPDQKITFINSGQKKADGKILWNLLNPDYSIHIHKSPTERFEQIEQADKPPQRPPMTDTRQPTISVESFLSGLTILAASIDELRYTINTQIFATLTTTQEERERLLERIRKQENKKVVGVVQ